MELALYHPDAGYYATATRRSGPSGDFVTSVDVGPLFGEMLAVAFAGMWRRLGAPEAFDLVEAGAGDGRLSRNVLDAAVDADARFYESIRLHLVERSAKGREAAARLLGHHASRVAAITSSLPDRFAGVLFANELIDALPVHVVVMREAGLREIYVDVEDDRLFEREDALSTPALEEHVVLAGPLPRPGCRMEVSLAASEWLHGVARHLVRGFVVLVDYGSEMAASLRTSSTGTLRGYSRHVVHPAGEGRPPWLTAPGECDMTYQVDFQSLRREAEAAGLDVLGLQSQMQFLAGPGLAGRIAERAGSDVAGLARRLALKTLLLPEGLGESHRVLLLGKDAGREGALSGVN